MVKGYTIKKLRHRNIKVVEESKPIQPLKEQKITKPEVITQEVEKKIKPEKVKLTPEESYARMLANSAKWNQTQKILGAERRIIRRKEDIIKLEAYVKELKGGTQEK